MNILLLLAHSIEEYDQVRLLTDLGYDVFSIGAYTNPAEPADDKRPALPKAPYHADLAAACERKRAEREASDGSPGSRIDWAKYDLPDEVVDWADVIIIHHFEHTWLPSNWDRLNGKRVIWRTVGQSMEPNERLMAQYRKHGLQIVRYSPRERHIPGYAGEDALIRFYKCPCDWSGWKGEAGVVGNITQHMAQRGDACGYPVWVKATEGLAVYPAGPGSEAIGGIGALPYDRMRKYLRDIRAYLYTGTRPASYTLGIIEAMMTGVPVVSVGPELWWPGEFSALFEGHEIALRHADTVDGLRDILRELLAEPDRDLARAQQERALELFGMGPVGAAWAEFLGAP